LRQETFFSKPIWNAGFRPFFILAMGYGAILPLTWALVFSGLWTLPESGLSNVQWHAHEMLFGFGWAVLGGFLLTASKNWVKIRGAHGAALFFLTLAWLFERVAVYFANAWSPSLRLLSLNLFLLSCGGYIVYSLWRYRHQDSFKDNFFFLIGIPLFLVAKNLLLNPETFAYGVAMAIGLFRLAFAVMFERTTTQFMKNAMATELPRRPWLDYTIKFLVLACVFAVFLPPAASGALYAAAALAMSVRFLTWRPQAGIRNFGIALMYVGHAGLALHLWLEAVKSFESFTGAGTLSVHVFTLLCMGVVIPGMMIRISQGHTGRKIEFATSDRIALTAMFVAGFFRVVMTQVRPADYQTWVTVSAAGWAVCFALLAWRLTPFLLRERIDGKVH
jgi:uncharacterized protein involved in response to NO